MPWLAHWLTLKKCKYHFWQAVSDTFVLKHIYKMHFIHNMLSLWTSWGSPRLLCKNMMSMSIFNLEQDGIVLLIQFRDYLFKYFIVENYLKIKTFIIFHFKTVLQCNITPFFLSKYFFSLFNFQRWPQHNFNLFLQHFLLNQVPYQKCLVLFL